MEVSGRVADAGGVVDRLVAGGVVDRATVAAVLGTTPRSVARWQAGTAAPRPGSVERLLELDAVAGAVLARLGDAGAAGLWLRRPHPLLDWDKPLDRVAAGRYRDALACLQETPDAPAAPARGAAAYRPLPRTDPSSFDPSMVQTAHVTARSPSAQDSTVGSNVNTSRSDSANA